MTFTSLAFALFVVVTILVYFLLPLRRYQWIVLLAASYVFYVYNSFQYTIFILFTTATIFVAARGMESMAKATSATVKAHRDDWDRKARKAFKQKAKKKQQAVLVLTLVANFGILFLLKYFNFMAGGLLHLIGQAPADGKLISLLLPLGISFYTFQATGYLIDVYRETVQAEKNPLRFALFVSFFPQIVQGPISTFDQLGGQLFATHRPEWRRFKLGGQLILWGMFKKLVIADRALAAINTVTDDYTAWPGETILFAALLYALQLYADFSGGIDIARGVAQILGIDLEQNFRQPYFSKSINEYWTRWHITLGAWMKNYVFYSLAVSELFMNMSRRMGKSGFGQTSAGRHISRTLPTALASFVVFLLIGIWHGANSRYIGFGLWNGGVIMFSVLMMPAYAAGLRLLHINAKARLWQLFQMVRTFVVILIGYYFDIAPNFAGALDMMWRSVADFHLRSGMTILREIGLHASDCMILVYGLVIIFYFSVRLEKTGLATPGDLLSRRSPVIQWLAILLLIISVIMFGQYGSGYDPADFVYMGF